MSLRLDKSGGSPQSAFVALASASLVMVACQTRDVPREPTAPDTTTAAAASSSAARASGPLEPTPSSPPASCATFRDVVVSDVMRVDGTTLYYADATAGLTIADVSDAARPRVVARLPLQGLSKALFVREGVAWVVSVDTDPKSGIEARTTVRAIDARIPAAARVIGEVTREGFARDVALVGGFVYVLRGARGRSVVDAFGIRDGAAIAFDSVELDGAPAQLAASPAGLAVVTVADASSRVSWLDLSMERAGAISMRDTVSVPGGVATWEHGERRIVDADEGQRVRLVTCATRACAPGEGATLRIVDFATAAGSRTPRSMPITRHGGLPVTRFTDGQLYVGETMAGGAEPRTMVHVVATDDGRDPRFVAHLPMRGRISALLARETSLVALGTTGSEDIPYESASQIVLHDIDVRRPEAPRIRSTVTFGSDWTWSVALEHGQAISFDPASHLVAVPFSAWRHADKRLVSGTQLVDITPYGAQPTAVIEAGGFVERAVFLDGHLVTVGPTGIASVDYASGHQPDVREHLLDLGPSAF